jgi:hypothetical protein
MNVGQSSIQFPSFDNHHHNHTNSNSFSHSQPSYQQPHLHHPQQQPYSHPMNPNPNSNPNSNSGGFPPPLGPQPLPPQMGGNLGYGSTQSFGQAAGMTGGGYRSDYGSGNEQSQQPQQGVKGGPGGGQQGGGGGGGLVGGLSRLSILPEEGSGGIGSGPDQLGDGGYVSGYPQGFQSHHPQHVGMQHHQQQQQQQHLNGMMSGPQGQGQTGYQAFGSAAGENEFGNQRFSSSTRDGNGLLSPTQGHLQPQQGGNGSISPSYHTQQTNGYRSPSAASPAHQHVGPNGQGGQQQSLGNGQQQEFPTSASSVTPEQAARYGIAGLGTPLGSAGIGAWMDGVNAAGMKSAGGAVTGGAGGGGGGGGNWLEASPLQQQQQQGLQGGQGMRRSLGERDGGVSPGLVSPGLNGGSGGAGPFGRDSRAGNNSQDPSGGNWSGFPINPASAEQGRNQQQQQQQQQQAGLGAKPQGSRGSGGSVQGQSQSRPSSVGQQRQASQAPPQQQVDQQQQQQSDETVDGNNAGDANGERRERWSRSSRVVY